MDMENEDQQSPDDLVAIYDYVHIHLPLHLVPSDTPTSLPTDYHRLIQVLNQHQHPHNNYIHIRV